MFGGTGSVNVANFDSMKLINSFYNSSNYLTLYNNESGEINAENWFVTTLHQEAKVFIRNDGNFTFTPSFINDVSVSAIISVGSEGQEFVESSGGTITITNNGSDSSSIYLLVIAAAAIFVIVVFFIAKKKGQN